MKLYTKLSIIGTAILLVVVLGGVWFWHSARVSKSPSHKELKPAVKTAHSVPRNKSIVKSKSKSKDNTEELEKFSDEEIEEALEWLDTLSESEESLEPALSESKQLAKEVEEEDDSEKEEDDAKIKDERFEAELKELWTRLNQNLPKYKDMWQERQRLLSIAKAKYGDAPIPWEPYGSRYTELRQAMRKLSEKIIIDAGRYAYGTGQPEAIDSEDGWIKKLLWEHGLKITSWPRD